jgi:plastocyanin
MPRFTLLFLFLAAPLAAGTVNGRVTVAGKNGKPVDPADVVVSLEGVKTKPKPAPASVIMKGKQFIPRVTVVPVGSSVAFPNEDGIFHNVFSLSGDNRFDLDLYKKPKTASWTFAHPGVAKVYCNIHPQMSAVVVVVDTPYYAKTDKSGTFTVADVPPGKYTLHAWHERGGETTTQVTVPAEGAAEAALTLDASKYKRVQHKNKFDKDYSTSETY